MEPVQSRLLNLQMPWTYTEQLYLSIAATFTYIYIVATHIVTQQ